MTYFRHRCITVVMYCSVAISDNRSANLATMLSNYIAHAVISTTLLRELVSVHVSVATQYNYSELSKVIMRN